MRSGTHHYSSGGAGLSGRHRRDAIGAHPERGAPYLSARHPALQRRQTARRGEKGIRRRAGERRVVGIDESPAGGEAMKRPIVVSACLAGKRCRYNGEHRSHAGVLRYLKRKRYVAVGRERLAGWGVRRPPVEFHGGGAQKTVAGEAAIVDNRGRNRTRSLMRGAKRALGRVLSSHATEAILKEKS